MNNPLATTQPVPAPNGCALRVPGSDAAASASCEACHASSAHRGHPIDVNYTGTGPKVGPASLRPIAEAVQRGVFLPDGQIRCVTCHDGRSPWKYNLRLPAGTTPTHAVDARHAETYENVRMLAPPQAGEAVAEKPLCLGCHALD